MTIVAHGRGGEPPAHSREDARKAKLAAAEHFRGDREVTSIGLGFTEDRTDYAVTFTISTPDARRRIPARICDVPTRVVVAGEAVAFGR